VHTTVYQACALRNKEKTLPVLTSGVRHGGVLNPYLFALYLDELSIQLGSARVGCTVGKYGCE